MGTCLSVKAGGIIPSAQRPHNTGIKYMKKLLISSTIALSAMLLFTGCLALQVGGGDKQEARKATIGQQLVDLKAARDAGAITESEYEIQKAKLLNEH